MAILSFGRVAVGAAVALAAVLVHRVHGDIYQPPSMEGKTVLITGGTTGLGLESAKRLAKAGARIIVTARSNSKGEKAVKAIQEYAPGSKASFKILQLDDLNSCKAATDWDLPAIDVLMLNAGIMALPKLQTTHLGMEKQFHTNHVGHFVFTASVEPFLSRNARIVVVSSEAHKIPQLFGGLDLEYSFRSSPAEEHEYNYGSWKSYGMSKLANVYFAAQLDAVSGYTAVSLHPGAVATDLGRQLTPYKAFQNLIDTTLYPLFKNLGFILSVEQGANTQVYLASTHDELVGGGYYNGMAIEKLGSFATDKAMGEKLWKQTEEISGVKFQF